MSRTRCCHAGFVVAHPTSYTCSVTAFHACLMRCLASTVQPTTTSILNPTPQSYSSLQLSTAFTQVHRARLGTCVFPVSAKNDELLIVRRFHSDPSLGALLGVEVKKALTREVWLMSHSCWCSRAPSCLVAVLHAPQCNVIHTTMPTFSIASG